uniref:E3 SUMO-protein ligase PIAS3 n=1 Tax=Rhipicephalus zambeziensis TaxID=60191 RepID=A0A224YLU1_9ACAR
MLPCQPFYHFLRELPLTPILSTKTANLNFFCGTYLAQSESDAATSLFIYFSPLVERSSLGIRTASLSLNGKAYFRLPFTMVNIFPLFDLTKRNCFAVWDEVIPEKMTVRAFEAVKVLEGEMLSLLIESAPYIVRREDTQALVKAHFAAADEAVIENLQMSLLCPIAKRKIRVPCRGACCQHMQCFDAYAYLALNDSTLHPSWRCPVCNDQVLLQDIRIDLLTLDILRKAESECSTVNLLPNGSWALAVGCHDRSVITIDDSPIKMPTRTLCNSSVIDLTYDSD